MKKYKIDHINHSIQLTKAFEEAAARCGSEEYELLRKLRDDFPEMKIVRKPRRTQKKAEPNRNLSYANMELYMSVFANAEELQAQFEIVKAMSKGQPSPYKYVKDWFVRQFPDYRELPDFSGEKLNLTVLPVEQPTIGTDHAA